VRHARRLRRDAAALGLDAPAEHTLAQALVDLGRRAFGDGAGVVRLALLPNPAGGPAAQPVGTTRELGAEPACWRTIAATQAHPGVAWAARAKREGVALYVRAREAAARAGADDALLFDAAAYLVEGARTNVFIVRGDGALVTPPLTRGAVAGVAREIVLEQVAEAREEDVPRAALEEARELILVNAVRAAVRVNALDGRAVGWDDGAPWAKRLRALLLSDPPPPQG
jgi:branched-subunit amino acid aminotransferase/4-amino-4-deoxychorismate lyase